jgi:hypothetical protein
VTDRPGEMDERDVDERFASIVAAWEGPVPSADDPQEPGSPATEGPGNGSAGGAPAGDGSAPDEAAGADDAPPRPQRSPWVNPSPLDIVVPPSTWRVPSPPEGQAPPGDSTATPTPGPPEAADEEHFEPPPVTLPPQEDLHFWGAVVGLVAGPLLLLWVALARPFYSDRWFAAGVVLSLVGFGLLVLRQPRYRDPGDDDDGARL